MTKTKRGLGELNETGDGFSWRARLGKGQRLTVPLRPGLSRAEAEERREVLAGIRSDMLRAKAPVDRIERFLRQAAEGDDHSLELVLALVQKQVAGALKTASRKGTKPTFRQLAEDWTSGALARRHPLRIKAKRSADTDEARLRKHVYPHPLASKPIDEVTLDDCEHLLNGLSPKLSRASYRQIAQLLQRVLRLAEWPLKLIERSPLPRAFLPPLGDSKALSYLFVDEDARLLRETSVPLVYRLLWGFLAREGMRLGEAQALTWGALDLKRGTVRLDENKTNDPRMWALNPGVVRALAAYRDGFARETEPSDPVFTDRHGRRMQTDGFAALFREHLTRIDLDVERPELFERSEARRPIRVHDLRATFITHSLATGRTETWISDRTGHASSEMIQNYKRDARTAEELGQGELTPLDLAIPELATAGNSDPMLTAGITNPRVFLGSRLESDSGRFWPLLAPE